MNQSTLQSARLQAEAAISALKSNPENSLQFLKYALETSTDPVTLFQSAVLIRDILLNPSAAGIRSEWSGFLLGYIKSRPNTFHHVRATVYQTIAIFTKLNSNFLILHDLQQMLQSDLPTQKLALGLMNALLVEYQGTRSFSLGMSMEFHQNCQSQFQSKLLLDFFKMVINSILANIQDVEVVKLSIACAENILCWNFVKTATLVKIKFQIQDAEKTNLRLPTDWNEVISPQVIELFFQVASMYTVDQILASKLTTCLSQLAGVNGPIFDDLQFKFQYLSGYSTHYAQYLNTVLEALTVDNIECYDKLYSVADIGKRLLRLNSPILVRVGAFPAVIGLLGHITLVCLKFNYEKDVDEWFHEPFENLLFMWAGLVEDLQTQDQETSNSLLKLIPGIFAEISSVYIDVKLHVVSIEEDEAMELEKDSELFEDQLINIALLARVNPVGVLSKLYSILDGLKAELLAIFSHCEQSSTSLEKNASIVQEKLHWIILISGHILADSSFGEIPEIFPSLLQLAQTSTEQNLVILLPNSILEMLGSMNFARVEVQVIFSNLACTLQPLTH